MSSAIDHVRYNCGMAGEEVADQVDALEREVESLRARLAEVTRERDAAVKDAALWGDLTTHHKFNNNPAVGYAINRAKERVTKKGNLK